MTDPEKPDEFPAHDSLFGQAAADNAPAPVIDHDPPPQMPPPAPGKVVVRRGGTPLLLTLLLTAGLGGGLYWVWSHPRPVEVAAPAAPVPAADPDTLAKLQALADRVDKLEKAPPPEAPQPATPQPATPASPAPASPNSDAAIELSKKLDDLTGQLSAMSARQDQLAAGLSKVEDLAAQKPADTPAPPPDHAAQEIANAAAIQAQQQLADLGGKTSSALTQQKSSLDALQQRIDKLEQDAQAAQAAAQAQAQSTTQISALDSRVQKLEQSEGQLQGATKDATLAVKLEAAQAALAAGKPLGDLPDAPPALQRFATAAPPTEAALRGQFPAVAAAILAASRPEEAHTTFLSRALARVEQSVTVRQGDHVIVGDPAAGVVARAEADLAGGDLAGAAAALDALTGRAAEAAKTWRDQARALLAARAALLSMAAHG